MSDEKLRKESSEIGNQALALLKAEKKYNQPNELQLESLIELSILRNQNQTKTLIVLPSGGGKTYIPIFDMQNHFQDKRLLFITHRNELVSQTVEYFKFILNQAKPDIGIFNAKRKDKDAQILIATIQTLSRANNLYKFKPDDFDYLVVDEFHHVAAETYKRVLNYFEPEFLLGLTATPYRFDGKDILEYCDNNIAYEVSLKEGIERDVLVPFIYYGLWDDIDYSNIEWNGYKYTEEDLNKVLLIDRRDEAIIRQFKHKVGNKKTIGFCCSVKQVRRSVKKFRSAGISCAGITYIEKIEERNEIIEDFKEGRIQIIFTRDIFNEGVDFPDVEALLFLRPTESIVVFLQQLGRGLRKSKGKENVLILDFIGNYKNAFKVREWLEGETGEGEKREKKPEYHYPLDCKVYFDKEVVDLLDRQEELFHTIYVTDQELIDEYFRLKKELEHQPTSTEFTVLSKYSNVAIHNHFGSWNSFLNTIGEPFLRETNIKKESVIDEYFRVKKKLGHRPTLVEFGKISKYSAASIFTLFGSWNDFLKSIGEPHLIETNIKKEKLIDEYFRLKKELGHQPTSTEFNILSKYYYQIISNRFGSWNDFLKSIGEPILRERRIKKEELIDEYFRLKKELGHQPSVPEFEKKSKYYNGTIVTHFGSWNSFLNTIGEPFLMGMNIKKEALIDEYSRVKKKLGHQPTTTEFSKHSKYSYTTVRIRFGNGSWKKGIEEIEKIIETDNIQPKREEGKEKK